MDVLTDKQMEIIQKIWDIPEDGKIKTIESVFMRFFTNFPTHREKFPTLRGKPLESLPGSPQLLVHINNLRGVFNQTIDSFFKENAAEEYERIWAPIAKSHTELDVSQQQFLDLKQTIISILTEICNLNEEQKTAWDKFISSMYKSIVFPKY